MALTEINARNKLTKLVSGTLGDHDRSHDQLDRKWNYHVHTITIFATIWINQQQFDSSFVVFGSFSGNHIKTFSN